MLGAPTRRVGSMGETRRGFLGRLGKSFYTGYLVVCFFCFSFLWKSIGFVDGGVE